MTRLLVILGVLCCASLALAQVGYDTSNGAHPTGTNPVTFSMTTANVANRLQLGSTASFAMSDPAPTVSDGPTYAAVGLTAVAAEFTANCCANDMWVRARAYYLVAPATGSNTYSTTYASVANGNPANAAISLNNVNQSTPTRTPCTASSSSGATSAQVSCTTTIGDELVCFVSLWAYTGGPGTVTFSGSGHTVRFQGNTATDDYIAISTKTATTTTTTCDWSWVNSTLMYAIGIPVVPNSLPDAGTAKPALLVHASGQ